MQLKIHKHIVRRVQYAAAYSLQATRQLQPQPPANPQGSAGVAIADYATLLDTAGTDGIEGYTSAALCLMRTGICNALESPLNNKVGYV